MTEMTSVGQDLFGFKKAIQIDHLNEEDLKIVELIFKDYK